MATVTITTNTASLFSHDVYFVFTLLDSSAESYTATLDKLGSIKYETDVPTTGTEVNSVGIKNGSLDVSLWDEVGSDSLIDIFQSAYDYGSRPDNWTAEMYFREKGGSYGLPVKFMFNSNDIQFDELTLIDKISLRPYSGYDLSNLAFYFTTYSSLMDVYDISLSGASTESSQISGEFLKMALYLMHVDSSPMSYPPASNGTIFFSDAYADGNPSSGIEWFVLADSDGGDNFDTSAINTNRVVGLMATLEGAIYGSCLGQPYYVARNIVDASLSIELDTDNIVGLKKEFFSDALYRSVTMYQSQRTGSTPATYSLDSNDTDAEKSISINFSGATNLNTPVTMGNIASSSTATESAYSNAILQYGVDNYGLAFGFDSPLRVSVEYWGIGDIRLYSIITFDADAPSYLQGKDFRIKNIEYDFTNDKVTMDLYELA